MKALTICQPYASLILDGYKRVENRTWPTRYRGPLCIHAGKSKTWLEPSFNGNCHVDPRYRHLGAIEDLPFGAVIAVAELIDCVHISGINEPVRKRHPWLIEHEHTHGPYCWVLANVQRIDPLPWRGSQGLFDIDDEQLNAVANRIIGVAT